MQNLSSGCTVIRITYWNVSREWFVERSEQWKDVEVIHKKILMSFVKVLLKTLKHLLGTTSLTNSVHNMRYFTQKFSYENHDQCTMSFIHLIRQKIIRWFFSKNIFSAELISNLVALHINIIIDTSITNWKNLKMDAMYFISSQKNRTIYI